MSASVRIAAGIACKPLVRATIAALAVMAVQPTPAHAIPRAGSAGVPAIAQKLVDSTHGAAGSSSGAAASGWVADTMLVNQQGRTVVRAHQTWQGHRVWGSAVLIHADPGKAPRLVAHNLAAAPAPLKPATLTADQAITIALNDLRAKGHIDRPAAELVVFPTQYHGGVRMMLDPVSHQYVLDRKNSVMSVRPADPYVWAYAVHGFAYNKQDGVIDSTLIIDARTGAIMNRASGLHGLAAPNPTTQEPSDVASRGVGKSQYSGDVMLNTTTHADGTSTLVDIAGHATAFNPYLNNSYFDANNNQILDANGQPISAIGLQTISETHDGYGIALELSNQWYDNNPLNVWGDSNQFVMYPYGAEMQPNGQTAAVDAHYGMTVAWDFYKNIFGRSGMDDQGTSTIAIVHVTDANHLYYDGANWDDSINGIMISDGTQNPGVDPLLGQPTPANPNGMKTASAIDIVGHEMTHGVLSAMGWSYLPSTNTVNEGLGIVEGSCDVMAQMIQAYARRPSGADAVIPATGNDWMIGAQIAPKPLRYLNKPSQDGASVDMWYSGLFYLDPHFSAGPFNRMFYLLSQGASSTVAALSYSPYLPGGMQGVGNDTAARIWYKALTEQVLTTMDYPTARLAAIAAATDLYGANTAQVAAVENAFAAINVGLPAGVTTARVSISMPLIQAPGTPLNPSTGSGYFAYMPIVSVGTSVKLQALVQNTSNTAVTWSAGGMTGAINSPGFLHYGGVFNADGTWTPDNDMSFHSITATSQADPLQFTEGVAWVVNGDADADNEFDAIDLGSVALSWGLDQAIRVSHTVGVSDGWVDSMNVSVIVQAFRNAYGGV